eukprot:Pgem_evm1s3267
MASLYFTTTSCGAANFIAAYKGKVEWKNAKVVDIGSHKVVETGEDFYKINSLGNVPAIVLEDGTLLNENVGTLNYIGTKGDLLGKTESEKFQTVNALGYLASEYHKSYLPVFMGKNDSEEKKKANIENVAKKAAFVATNFLKDDGNNYLVGDSFTVADSYFYIIISWAKFLGFFDQYSETVQKYYQRISELDFVKEAHAEMKKIEDEQKAKSQ